MIDPSSIFLIAISKTRGIGNAKIIDLLNQYLTPKAAYDSLVEPYPLEMAQNSLEYASKHDIHVTTLLDPIYHKLVGGLPPILYTMGNLELLYPHLQRIAIVGSRTPTAAGIDFTNKIAQQINKRAVVASGMARGIDAIAHMGATNSIAVVPTGLDTVYPASSKPVQERILQNNGLVMSEYHMGSTLSPKMFAKRNFLLATISDKILITEATLRSGSLMTARHGLSLGKKIYAVPGHPDNLKYNGTNYLIQKGAYLVQTLLDIMPSELPTKLPTESELFSADILKYNKSHEDGYADKEGNTNSTIESRILELLSVNPITIEHLTEIISAHIQDIDIQNIRPAITKMEIEGRIKILSGNMIIKHETHRG